jgi:RuvB-like protein 1 (pontin 52)
MKIQEVKSLSRTQRVYAHTHLQALGLREDGTAEPVAAGFAGQEAAREVFHD